MIPTWVYTLPYVEGGRTKQGADCWGLVVLLYKELFDIYLTTYQDITLPSIKECHETSEKLQAVLMGQQMFEEVDNPEYGDVILLNVLGEPLHIGFCLDDTTMIHTGRKHGVVIENFTEMKWKRKIAGFYRKK